MLQITLRFLGGFTVLADDVSITGFHSDKARALLAYLAIEPHMHARATIAGLLWPEISSSSAMTNLRNTLYRLRLTLDRGAPGMADALLEVTRQDIGCKPSVATVDVLEFEKLLEAPSLQLASDPAARSATLEGLYKAVSLYQGDLLAGFGLADSPDFEEWLLIRREVLQQRAVLGFSTLATYYETSSKVEQAYKIAARLLELDPFREETYRQMMRCLAQMGQPHLALGHFQQMRRRFQEEMGVLPSSETLDLVARIKRGEFASAIELPNVASGAANSPDYSSPPLTGESAPGPDGAPTSQPQSAPAIIDIPELGQFFGRVAEGRLMTEWLRDGCRVVAVLGIGGVGKTSLVAHWVRELAITEMGAQFDHILWRSLVNAPPLHELLDPLLQVLSGQQLIHLPENLGDRLRLLLQYLREKRVVLVLDNLESILDNDQASVYRPGYAEYGQLIEFIATREHRSHLIFTSRERPAGLARLDQNSLSMRALQVDGLDIASVRELLTAQGLRAREGEDAMLMTRYSGNPLALKLVADTVNEIFDGEIAEFLVEESLIFDDIRSVLDQQFARLSPLEQSILFSLAVAREPLPAAMLRAELLAPPVYSHLIESLRRLQRHSLIVRQADGFMLQNVVTEYLTDRLVTAAFQEIVSRTMVLLHEHPLLQARAKEYVRQSQARLLLAPLARRLLAHFGASALASHLQSLLVDLRAKMTDRPSYVGGNLLNLLLHMKFDVTGYNFAGLNIRQGVLQHARLYDVDFSGADFSATVFTSSFGAVQCLSIKPDFALAAAPEAHGTAPQPGDLLAAGTVQGEIWLWQLDSGEVEGVLPSYAGNVFKVHFAPKLVDGKVLLASSYDDGSIAIWDITTKTRVKTLLGHTGPVQSLAFFPDGVTLASGSEDHDLCIWDIRSGDLLQRIEHHEGWVSALACHPQEHLLASGDGTGMICLWQFAPSGIQGEALSPMPLQPLAILQQHEHAIWSLAFSPDGARLASAGVERVINLWDVADTRLRHQLVSHTATRSVTFSTDSARRISGGADGNVRIWDVQQGTPLNTLRGHTGAIRAVAINTCGNTLISGGLDEAIRTWRLDAANQVQAAEYFQGHHVQISSLVFTPDGADLYVGTQRGILAKWDTGNWTAQPQPRPWQISFSHRVVKALALHPTLPLLASGSYDNAVRVSNLKNQFDTQTLNGHTDDVFCVIFTSDGKFLVSSGADDRILFWQADTTGNFRLNRELNIHRGHVNTLACSPTQPLLMSGGGDVPLCAWNLATGEQITILGKGRYLSTTLAFHPSGRLLASADLEGHVRLLEVHDIDLEHNQLQCVTRHTFTGHRAGINCVIFSADGRFVVSASSDHDARMWDVATGDLRHVFTGHISGITTLGFTPEGDTLATGSSDSTVKIWDVNTGACINTLFLPEPYDGMNIYGARGLTATQRQLLRSLGAVERA